MVTAHGSQSPRAGFWGRLRRKGVLASAAVFLSVFLGNAVYLLGIRSNDPVVYHSGLGSPTLGVVETPFVHHHAAHTIDANDGWTAQALGRLAAHMWSHGHIPLWNVHEGLGTPLAGEMQSAAFFLPFVLLQLLPNGIFLMHVVLELVCGFTTLAFLRRLGLGWLSATLGGVLFGLNGVFAVMTNAPFNPIAFLPMALWGVELVRADVIKARRPVAGLTVTALGLAWMLYAGFPETALLQGLFIGLWVVMRVVEASARRIAFLAWSAASAVAGVLIAAPILAAMQGFLPYAFTAYHSGGSSAWSYRLPAATGLALPYLAGPMSANAISSGVAGYVTLPACFLAIIGLCGRRSNAFKATMAGLLALLISNAYGLSAANAVINVVPGMSIVLVYKYAFVIIAFIVVVLAAFGLDDVRRGIARRRVIALAAVICATYLAVSAGYGWSHHKFMHHSWTMGILVWTCIIGGAVCALTWRASRKVAPMLALALACFVGVDNVGTYMVPQLSAGRPAPVDTAPITYLQKNLGTSRFFSLGPIQPNYGSYWGISQLNVNDLPVPQKFRDFVINDLKPRPGTPAAGVTGWAFTSGDELAPLNFSTKDARAVLAAYGQEQHAYREAGVKYLVMGHGVADAKTMRKLGLTKVLTSKKTEIWQDSAASSSMTTVGDSCRLALVSLSSATTHCAHESTLTRRQLAMPGWYVTVNGHRTALGGSSETLYQQVRLPAGTASVQFDYRPDHFRLAAVLSFGVFAWLAIEWLLLLRRRRISADVL